MRPTSRAPHRHALALLLAAPSLLLGACLLDLGGLSDGATSTGSGGSTATGVGSTGGGPGGSTTGCALLDCTACADACADGGCAPTPIATSKDADRPWAVAVSDTGVYWVNQHGYSVARRTQGSDAAELLTTAVAPSAIAVAAGYVVWAEQSGLWGCPAESCEIDKKKIYASAGPGTLQGVAFDGQLVYFTDHGTEPLTGRVLRCAPEACATPLEIAKDQLAPQAITLTASAVLWTDLGNGEQNGNLYKASKEGQGVTVIASSLVLPTALAADEANVYFTRWSGDGKVLRCSHTTGFCDAPSEVAPKASPLALPFDIALAGGRVYWSNSGDGSVQSCPLQGCGQEMPRLHASGRENLRKIALGTSCLFWVDDTLGSGVFETFR